MPLNRTGPLSLRSLPVLDFQRGPKPRNFLARREQWRLLVLVLMLGLVVIFALEARDPEHYRWLVDIDDRRLMIEEVGRRSNRDPGSNHQSSIVNHQSLSPSRLFPGVDASHLASIRDNRPLDRPEWDAWLHFFNLLEENDEATLQEASTGRVGFVQLLGQSKEYRGELVTTGGIVRRAHPAKTPENEYGLSDYYQIWLWPTDHPNDPVAVWCLHLPEGFPIGMEMAEAAEVTGLYFKLWAYKAADGKVRTAPMLLARTIHWRKKPVVAEAPSRSPLPLGLLVVGAAAFAVLATVYVYYRTSPPGSARAVSLLWRNTLRGAESADVGAALQQLADSEDAPGP